MKRILVVVFALMWSASAQASNAVPVTVDNFVRTESDRYFARFLQEGAGQLGKFHHERNIASVDNQPVIRNNRDVLLSSAVFDLDAGAATITLPDPGKRFLSILVISQDHYMPIPEFGGGTYTLTGDNVGTRYAVVVLRIFVDPNDPRDLAAVHALQDAVKVNQPGGPGKFESPNWDEASLNKVRDAAARVARYAAR